MTPYSSLCDDFGIYAYVNTKMELPTNRETVLHFFNSLQKTFPTMTDFDSRGNNEYVLEEDREQGNEQEEREVPQREGDEHDGHPRDCAAAGTGKGDRRGEDRGHQCRSSA